MSVHYKFIKAALEYSTVTFDGIHITVADLKKEIIEQKHLKQNADFDLQIMNAQTEEVYEDENTLIPKNTSVIVARLPVSNKRNSSNAPGGAHRDHRQQHHARNPPSLQPSAVAKGVDLASMDATEEEKIKAMMSQSTADYDPSRYQRLRGGGQHGRVPPSYRCNKCGNGSHWIKDCPLQTEHTDIKKSTGIPRSFMVHVDGPDVPGALMTPEGRFAVPAVDHAAYMEQKKPAVKPPPSKPKIPDELVCTLCDDLMTDALMVPCCANSYCDDCIRKALLDSDEQECPGCHEKEISPTSLIPNRFLRSTVNTFKNDTGYSKPQPSVEKESSVIMVDLTEKKSEESERRKLSLDELPDDLFPHSPRKIDPDAEAKEKEAEGNEDEEKTDLYDFNDGSIPSPFATPPPAVEPPESEQAIRTIGTTNHFYTGQLPGHMGRHHQPSSHIPTHHQGMGHHGRPPKVDGYRPPRTPLQSGMPPLPQTHHGHHPPPLRRPPGGGPGPGQGSGPPPGQGPPESHEPPPPGFGDMLPLPPGEDRAPTPTGRGREENMHRRDERREMGDRGPDQDGPPRGSLLPLPGIPPFNPSQPPPGFSGPQGGPQSQSQKGPVGLPPPGPIYPGPPQGSGPPPPMGMVPPNQNYPPPPYHGNYGMPPGGGGNRPPPYHSGMRGPHPRDRERDRYTMREKSMRKPLPRDGRPRERDRPDEIKPGVIEDPLKEFERLMREKDRRKKLQQERKRSRSRSYSPGGRRTPPSPFPKRSRSRSYSRSPSPKRKRSAPLRRRESYSRTPSRSPPPPRRRLRSRSRSRNRSLTPPNALSKRRSPRRAPPFSPSPPPSRFPLPRKEKEDFYDRATRYEGGSGSSRYYNSNNSNSGPNNGKPYSSTSGRDYPEPVAKYDVKYGDAPPPKYDQGSHPAGAPSSGGGGGGGGGKYEKFEPRRSREREMYLHHSSSSSAGPPPPSSYRDNRDRDRDRGRDLRERESGDHNRDREAHRPVPYEFDPTLMPPGTETHMQTNSNLTAVPPSLFELEIPPPSGFSSQNNAKGGAPLPSSASPQSYHSSHHYHHHHPSSHPSSRHGQPGAPPPQAQKDHHNRKSREKDSVPDLGSLSVSPESEPDDDSHKDRDGRKRHHRKKSREGSSEKGDKKKERKEKKKHKKKKEKEEKKLKKNKKTKSSDKMSKDGSEDEHTTTTADETGPSRRNSATETSNSNIKEEAERIPADGDKLGMEMIRELERRTHEIDSKNSNLTVIVCDSTVKSPDRSSQVIQPFRNLMETEYGEKVDDGGGGGSLVVKKAIDTREVDGGAIRRDLDQYGPQDTIVANLSVSDVVAQDLYQGREFSDKNESRLTETSLTDKDESLSESTKLEEIPVVSSKWDQFGEDEDPESLLHPEGSTPKDSSRLTEENEQALNVKSTAVEKKVTSEVLKRAENAIFQKAISAISGSSRSSSASRRGSSPHSSSSKRKVYIESYDVPQSEKDGNSKDDGDGSKAGTGSSAIKPSAEVESKTSSAASVTAVKRSVRDRLGSKVTEDAVDASASSSSRTRDRSSPSRDRDKDRQIKSQVGNAPSRDRDRDRKKPSRSRSRSPRGRRDRHSRSRSPRGGRDRERDRDRPRPTARRSQSRSRRRSVSRSRRDTRRASPRSSSRTRHMDRNRNMNRQRTPLKLGRRSRSISSSQTKRPRSKSGSRSKDSRQNRDREPRRLSREPKDREPSPPGEGSSGRLRTSPSRTKKTNKTENEEAWAQQANKFVPIGSSGGAGGVPEGTGAKSVDSEKSGDVEWQQSGSNPVPLAVRKQKGRINIKLSSTTTSKSEPGKSSSSSSDEEDHQGKGDGKDRSSGDSDDSSRREERKRKKERKKAKRRRSESSSSSSSDDSAPRKSKKSKKKKKKSKKKKKVK